MGTTTSRRRVLGALGVGAFAFGLPGGRAVAQDATPEATQVSALPVELPSGGIQPDGTWAFTDDLGVTVTADAAPTKVISHVGMAAALYDFGFEVVGYYNPATDEDGNPLPIAGDLPLDRLTHVGDYDEVDVELMVSLGADLFIGQNYDVTQPTMWPFSEGVLEQIRAAVPVLSFAYGDSAMVLRNIESIENLAAALGADVTLPEIAVDREAFTTAAGELETVLAEKDGLTALFISASNTGFWIDSAGSAATRYYRSLGMDIVPAEVAEVSWETFLEIKADIIFLDDRAPGWWSAEQLVEGVPVWELHPAVKAGQVAPWRAQFISSYRGFAPVIEEVVEWVRVADTTIAE